MPRLKKKTICTITEFESDDPPFILTIARIKRIGNTNGNFTNYKMPWSANDWMRMDKTFTTVLT